MDISVMISWKTVARPSGWTMEVCPYCQERTPTRVEDLMEQVSVYFIPVHSNSIGHQCTCDVCERAVAEGLPESRVELAAWRRSDGAAALAKELEIELLDHPPDRMVLIHSLLRSATDRSTLNALDISFGLTTGCILGGLFGAAVGYFLLPTYLDQLDRLGCVFAGILGGLLIGGIAGASIAASVLRSILPYRQIERAITHYSVDGKEVVRLASAYPFRIRSAAARAHDSATLRSMHQSLGTRQLPGDR